MNKLVVFIVCQSISKPEIVAGYLDQVSEFNYGLRQFPIHSAEKNDIYSNYILLALCIILWSSDDLGSGRN